MLRKDRGNYLCTKEDILKAMFDKDTHQFNAKRGPDLRISIKCDLLITREETFLILQNSKTTCSYPDVDA